MLITLVYFETHLCIKLSEAKWFIVLEFIEFLTHW
jgi:hypothetical protein